MNTVHILLVEDNEGDIMLTKEAFEDSELVTQLSIVRDGKQAIDFLNKAGDFTDANTPDLLLLDINLPKKNGLQVLQYIKGNELLKPLPVIMLTTSSSESDINLCYNNYANCYITKPVDANGFLSMITKVENFWVSLVHLPVIKNPAHD